MEPLNNRTIQHFLNFISNGEGRIQIDEPIGFDAAEFVDKQEDGRYGRDVSFSGGEIDFGFPNSSGHRFGYQFALLITYDLLFGYESEVQYILQDTSGREYVVGQLDYFTKETDQITYFNSTVIQSTQQATVKRRKDIAIDLFGLEDLDDNVIAPVTTSNLLLEAKPIIQKSSWGVSLPYWTQTAGATPTSDDVFNQNPFTSITNSEINDTIRFIERGLMRSNPTDTDFYDQIFNTGWINAQEDLSNITFNIKGVVLSFFIATGTDFNDNWGTGGVKINFDRYVLPIGQDNYVRADLYPNDNFPYTQRDNLPFTVEFIGNENIGRFGDFSGTADRYDVTITDITVTLDAGIPRDHRLSTLFNIERINTITEKT